MKKTLLKLIEYSILPAFLMVLGKFAGIFFVATLWNIPLDFDSANHNLLQFNTFVPVDSLMVVSSYSDLFMFATILTGMSFIIIRAIYFHDSHISNESIAKLAKYNLLNMISTSFKLYHSGIIWLGFMWLATLLIIINFFQGLSYSWVLVISLLFSLSFSIIFFKDLFAEIDLIKN